MTRRAALPDQVPRTTSPETCGVCGSDIPDERWKQCSRRCTITAADRRRRGYPINDFEYREALKTGRSTKAMARSFVLQPLPSLVCEWQEWGSSCRCKPTHWVVETWGVRSRRKRGVFCADHARRFAEKLSEGAK